MTKIEINNWQLSQLTMMSDIPDLFLIPLNNLLTDIGYETIETIYSLL